MSLTQDWSRYPIFKRFRELFSLASFACVISCHDNIDVYNRPGFDAGTRPRVDNTIPTSPPVYVEQYAPQQSAPGFRVAPDYYYYQPYYPQQQRPASRSYSNPYSFQPSTQYPYYDADQYYTPPAAYNPSAEYENTNAYRQPEQGPARSGTRINGGANGTGSVNPLMH